MLKGFLAAVATGTIAGTAFPAIMLALAIFGSSSSDGDVRTGLGIAAMIIMVPFALVSVSALLVGVPTTLLLRKMGRESATAYIFIGGLSGFLIPVMILAVAEGNASIFFSSLPVSILGAISGALTGRAWWKNYRAGIAESFPFPVQKPGNIKPDNTLPK